MQFHSVSQTKLRRHQKEKSAGHKAKSATTKVNDNAAGEKLKL